jgi:hypothetical protein
VDRVDLASRPDLPVARALALFASPRAAIETLTAEFECQWDLHRSSDWEMRKPGLVGLDSSAYFQWVGYRDALAIECSGGAGWNDHKFTAREVDCLLRWGFHEPNAHIPNFWMDMDRRDQADEMALRVVAVMTAVFGVYAG